MSSRLDAFNQISEMEANLRSNKIEYEDYLEETNLKMITDGNEKVTDKN